LGEDWYELEHAETAQGLRQEGYGPVLGGCTLVRLFGNQQIWSFNSPNSGLGTTTPSWQSQLGSSGSVGQQLLGRLFRSRSFQLLVPDISNVVMKFGSSGGSICARTSDGQIITVYLPFSQTVTIDMSKITDAGICNWYNPRTGVSTEIGNFANSGERNFTSPDSNNWVLVIDSAAAKFKAPSS
jgi:Putative collagen-binding domain of a collagenase